MGRKEFWFKFDKLVENVRNSVSLDNTVTFMLNVIIVFFINVLLMCNLFSMRGILFQLETSSKISIMTVIVSSSISYLSLVYFRYKDNRKEYSKVKLDVYKDLLPMLYNNNEIIKAYFVSYIERDSDNQTIKNIQYTKYGMICNMIIEIYLLIVYCVDIWIEFLKTTTSILIIIIKLKWR